MGFHDYQPGLTHAHDKTDVGVITVLRQYLATHAPEQLLRCVASAAVETQKDQEPSSPLAWLAWQANELANGNNTCDQEELSRLRGLEARLKQSPGRPRIETENPKTIAQRKWRDKQK